MSEPSSKFKAYAFFSVQVDQYYATTRILARHFDALKATHRALPSAEIWNGAVQAIPDPVRPFCHTAVTTFNYLGTTGLFSDAPFEELKNLPEDMINFGLYTCYCFQWTLFENFVKESVLELSSKGLLESTTSEKLESLKWRTEQFLLYIDSGKVFGRSPFTTALPVAGWTPRTESCGYSDLDKIRVLRNKFIHAVSGPAILSGTEMEKERLYERSMWLLRQFAGNVDQCARESRANKSTWTP